MILRKYRSNKLIIVISLFFICSVVVQSPSRVQAVPIPPILIELIKTIIGIGAKIGIDKAGEHYLGKDWKVFKSVLEPLIKAFPGLLKKGNEAEEAAKKAFQALLDNPNLITEIEERYIHLGAQQGLILEKMNMFQLGMENYERRISALEDFARTGKFVEQKEALQPKYRFIPFQDALRKFITAANDDFLIVRGELIKSNYYDTKVYLPGAESCRLMFSKGGNDKTCSYCTPLKEMLTKKYYWNQNKDNKPLSKPSSKSCISCTMFNGILPLKHYPTYKSDEIKKSELMADMVYQEMVSKINRYLPSGWQKSELECYEDTKKKGYTVLGGPRILETVFTSPDGITIRVKRRLYSLSGYFNQSSVKIYFHPK